MGGVRILRLFRGGKQVEQQGGQARPLQNAGDETIARTVAAAAAAVREQDDTTRPLGDDKVAFKDDLSRRDMDRAGIGFFPVL